jgi:hypothetical protein
MRKLYLATLLAIATTSSAALAGDSAFTPDAAATWSARTLRMASIMDDAEAGTFGKASLARACDGLTGEQMKHEYGKEPRWALAAQLEICSAFDGWAGKFGGSKGPCGTLKKGLKDLANATPETSPPEVVAAAGKLRETVDLLLAATRDNKRACRL